MSSTFTSNTGIELIADGEQTGAWGQRTNDNFDIVDRALNGSVNISLSGTTGTVTTGQGSTTGPETFGQFAVLVFTGSPSGTNTVTIAPNTAQKTYFVTNSTAQTVVLSQGSGANVSVPAGLSKIVFTNGAGAGAAVFDITNTLSGTFTGNLTGDVTGNLTGDLTGNVNITGGTIDGTVIGGSTPAAISGTNGAFSGNVGIGTTNPVQPLDVVGGIDVSGRLRSTGGGSAAEPSIQPGPDGNTGIFHIVTDTIGFSTAGSERLRITASGTLQSPGGSAFTGTVATGATLGAIIQRGKNANGEFVRFADGTQICTHLLTVGTIEIGSASGVFRSSPVAWTFPAAFSVTPNGQGGCDSSSNQIWGMVRPSSATTADVVLYSGAAVTSTRSARVTAIRRWF